LVDIEAHVLMDLQVLVPVFGCSGSRHIRADRLPSSGATRVIGNKHPFPPRCVCTQL
jgi:hypothetical protein